MKDEIIELSEKEKVCRHLIGLLERQAKQERKYISKSPTVADIYKGDRLALRYAINALMGRPNTVVTMTDSIGPSPHVGEKPLSASDIILE